MAIFYERAFADVMIGHFFFNSDIKHITEQQTRFVTAMLGGPSAYSGKPLRLAHKPFRISIVHFNRRQVLMREVLEELQLRPDLASAWLQIENQLRPLIINA